MRKQTHKLEEAMKMAEAMSTLGMEFNLFVSGEFESMDRDGVRVGFVMHPAESVGHFSVMVKGEELMPLEGCTDAASFCTFTLDTVE